MRTVIIINDNKPTFRTQKDITDNRFPSEHRMCKDKIKNKTLAAAEAQCKRVLIGFKSVTHTYVCPLCSTKDQPIWHIGHTPEERRRTNELRGM